jgi:hypothetical protein
MGKIQGALCIRRRSLASRKNATVQNLGDSPAAGPPQALVSEKLTKAGVIPNAAILKIDAGFV